jgi:hypothetical protein
LEKRARRGLLVAALFMEGLGTDTLAHLRLRDL